MTGSTLKCLDERRRQLVRDQADGGLNGIDYVEIVEGTQQRLLCVHFFGEVPSLLRANVQIEGGQRIRDIKVVEVEPHKSNDPEHQDCLRIEVDRAGDFSCYKVCLNEVDSEGLTTNEVLKGFDPRYACAEFSFKGECPNEFDCKKESVCLPEVTPAPEINYLAKDYASFRQLIFDRLSLLMPDWQERHVPDLGVALVEVLAYTGDYLSYYQDSVATEAYLNTARQRVSVRRHARLVDYFLHEGCNARAWVVVTTDQDLNDPGLTFKDIYFTAGPDDAQAIVFEPLVENSGATIQLFQAHNEIHFYTWGDEECCLPKGATSATLRDEWIVAKPEPPQDYQQAGGYKQDDYNAPAEGEYQSQDQQDKQAEYDTPPEPRARYRTKKKSKKADYYPPPAPEPPPPTRTLQLEKGDVLIFEEVIGPKTGSPNDADNTRRHVVRLTKVTPVEDPLLTEKPVNSDRELPIPLLEIEWAPEDALPFHLCLSARLPVPDCSLVTKISVARGNVILVDHGRTLSPEYLGQVQQMSIHGECACETSVMDLTTKPQKFKPVLERGPLTFSERLEWNAPAALSVKQDPRLALPQILSLTGLPAKCAAPGDEQKPVPLADINPDDERWRWHSRLDLLASSGLDRHFVVEIDNDGRACLRFGDGELGRLPEACMIFHALYRVGNGPSGNVGADVITTVGWRNKTVSGLGLSARNPLPATGGLAQEPMSEARMFAPKTFLKQLQRAITADDYARLAERYPGSKVQRAGASLRWNGSWYAAEVSIDPFGGESGDPQLFKRIKGYLHRYRRMGHDVEVELARYVPLKIEMKICVKAHYLRGHVEAALLEVFGSSVLPDGRLGFFHPDNLTFGEGIYLSKLVAAAQVVTGVDSVEVTKLERLGEGDRGELEEGILKLGPLEVPQLDNDPNFPERGTLKITLRGGR